MSFTFVPQYFLNIDAEFLNHLFEAWETLDAIQIHKFSSEVGPMEPILLSQIRNFNGHNTKRAMGISVDLSSKPANL